MPHVNIILYMRERERKRERNKERKREGKRKRERKRERKRASSPNVKQCPHLVAEKFAMMALPLSERQAYNSISQHALRVCSEAETKEITNFSKHSSR